MPVVTAHLDEQFPVEAILPALATAVTEALNLPGNSVHVMHVPVHTAVTGAQSVQPWPTVLLHGGRRPSGAMEAARIAAQQVLSDRCEVDLDQIWVQWVLTE